MYWERTNDKVTQGMSHVYLVRLSVTSSRSCINALSWAKGGELLLSGGDDTTVRIWKMDTINTQQEYPFTSRCVIHTGHRANIFSAKMLPHSSRM
jgi:WD40 repeat protein